MSKKKEKALKKKIKKIDIRTQMICKDGEHETSWNYTVSTTRYDPFYKQTTTYARIWAKLMQVELCKGKSLAKIVDKCATNAAKLVPINDTMFAYAVEFLGTLWINGDALISLYCDKEFIAKEMVEEAKVEKSEEVEEVEEEKDEQYS